MRRKDIKGRQKFFCVSCVCVYFFEILMNHDVGTSSFDDDATNFLMFFFPHNINKWVEKEFGFFFRMLVTYLAYFSSSVHECVVVCVFVCKVDIN